MGSPALVFSQLFRDALASRVEYSFGPEEDHFTTMVSVGRDQVARAAALAAEVPFAGAWAWSVERFVDVVEPDSFLFRADWSKNELTALTLYCRFPIEPSSPEFEKALGAAHPFRWSGPDPSRVASALAVEGPRGIAFRVKRDSSLRTALYFKGDRHAGTAWRPSLAALLDTCQYSQNLATKIENDLGELYQPGPVGVIGVDDGEGGVPRALKFDPPNVPLSTTFAFLERAGASPKRVAELRSLAFGLRADAATYLGVQYGPRGLAGWRVYFSCEPAYVRPPGGTELRLQPTLRPIRRLPHY